MFSRFIVSPPEDVWLVLREEWRVNEFARPPGQATRSSNKVVSFKKYSFYLLRLRMRATRELSVVMIQ